MPFPSACLAVICLWAHLCSVTHLLPSITAAIASIDGQHHVPIRFAGDDSRVVLSHDETDGRKSACHAHSVLSQILVALDESPATEADHLVDFNHSRVSARRASPQRSELVPLDLLECHPPLVRPLNEAARVPFAVAPSDSVSLLASSITVARTIVILV